MTNNDLLVCLFALHFDVFILQMFFDKKCEKIQRNLCNHCYSRSDEIVDEIFIELHNEQVFVKLNLGKVHNQFKMNAKKYEINKFTENVQNYLNVHVQY